ncbi:MAG: hypothetical protein CBC42_05190 [Betaproteobacteria bacterium TMED82]|nr:MAG: hypothetical protein CBC42_05190 [Betaproteobacteria bacterium TMED82]|tara:strand:+ start:99176 stop:99361 length:186 start_codon:yes stop_codon:yes gene_type:complete
MFKKPLNTVAIVKQTKSFNVFMLYLHNLIAFMPFKSNAEKDLVIWSLFEKLKSYQKNPLNL